MKKNPKVSEKVHYRIRNQIPFLLREINSSKYSELDYKECTRYVSDWCHEWNFDEGTLEVIISKMDYKREIKTIYEIEVLREVPNP